MFCSKSFENRLLGGLATAVALLTLLAMVVPQASQALEIDFDDLTAPGVFGDTTRLTNEYQAEGVVFQGPGGNDGGAVLSSPSSFGVTGFSSPNVLAFNPSASMADGGIPQPPETILFPNGASRVSALVGSSTGAGIQVTMTAYDSGDSVVDSDSVVLAPALASLSVSGDIAYVVVDIASPEPWVLDDLNYHPVHPCCNTAFVPGCNDPAIEAAVCAGDPFCCSNWWDSACVSDVTTVYGDNCECCAAASATGCYSPTAGNDVSDCVCASDPWCCEVSWDGICAGEVESLGCGLCGCGNGTIDPGEDCDGSNLGGETCQSQGFFTGILLCDGSFCTFDTSACTNVGCGNGVIDPDEDCDGANLGGETCQSQGFFAGTLSCDAGCTFDTSACTNVGCGNGVIDPGEDCDGANLGGETCQSQGFVGGTLSCFAGCTFDTSACTNATPTPTPPSGVTPTPTPPSGVTPTPTPPPGVTPTPSPTPPPTAPIQGEIQSVKVTLKFNKLSMDKIQVKIKNWQLPAGVVPTDVTVNVGGAEFTGTLDAKGKYKSADGRDGIKMKEKNGLWKLTVKRKNNSFAADLADEGLTNADNPKPGAPVTVPLTIEVGGSAYGQDVNLLYKSKLGVKGTAK